jgi:hypothetical protein
VSERALWDAVRGAFSPFGRLVRVENPADPGTPDVCYVLRGRPVDPPVTGWIELKHENRWPSGRHTPLFVGSLTREQVNWHTFWALKGGRVATILQVDRSYLLLDHLRLGNLFSSGLTRGDLEGDPGVPWGENRLPAVDFLKVLTRPLAPTGRPPG